MKLNLKPLVETTEQLNVRIPGTLKKRMDNTRARAKDLGVDFNATLIGNLEEFEREFDALITARESAASTSPALLNAPNINSASASLVEPHQPKISSASSNGLQRERP
jgi:hypothetical protein